jgi:hypothetical protein
MANFKITNPQVIGKLKLSAEVASKALQINASGELESSSVSTTELGYLSGVTSAIQTQLGSKASSTDLSNHVSDTNNPHSVTKAQVGLSNVPNVDATDRANHTGTQLASTISDFSSAAKSAAVADAIADGVTDIAPSQNAVFDALALKADASSLSNYIPTSEKGANNGVATLDAGGKVPVSQLPNSVMEFKGVFDPATATFTDGSGNAGDVYLANAAGSYDAGSGSITYAIGDWAVHNGSVFQKSLNSNAVVSVNGQTGVVTLTKSDVGLSNVDNTSDATKNSAVATLTNKTLTAPVINSPTGLVKADVGLSNVDNVQQLPMSYLDTDDTLAADSDTKVPSQKAIKAYVADQIGASAHAGDIAHSSFSAANNQASAANVTGLAFAAANVRSFKAQVSVSIDATTDLNEVFELTGIQLASGFVMASSSVGDDSGVVFTITSAGQVQYTSQNSAGFVSNTIKFRAQVTDV